MSDKIIKDSAASLIHELPSITDRIKLEELFERSQPIEVELGSGDASFLLEYAALHPERNFIGVERLLGRLRKLDRKGRRAKRRGINKITMQKNLQRIVEERTAKRYPNLEVLNSYWVGKDGKHMWFEIILIDKHHPCIANDPVYKWIVDSHHKGRCYRGLTAAGKRGRGLNNKGKGAERSRPSNRANNRQGK